ncbi:MAG: hypothetical protein K2H84_05410, partial [Paramuribaculum sp.]|nr:hypothetical protein [Paramuribaculum sp.]
MKLFKIYSIAVLLGCTTPGFMKAEDNKIRLTILETTDVHGNYFPYNFITRSPWGGSMARVATFVDSI